MSLETADKAVLERSGSFLENPRMTDVAFKSKFLQVIVDAGLAGDDRAGHAGFDRHVGSDKHPRYSKRIGHAQHACESGRARERTVDRSL